MKEKQEEARQNMVRNTSKKIKIKSISEGMKGEKKILKKH